MENKEQPMENSTDMENTMQPQLQYNATDGELLKTKHKKQTKTFTLILSLLWIPA
jgi:hypothetical protein